MIPNHPAPCHFGPQAAGRYFEQLGVRLLYAFRLRNDDCIHVRFKADCLDFECLLRGGAVGDDAYSPTGFTGISESLRGGGIQRH